MERIVAFLLCVGFSYSTAFAATTGRISPSRYVNPQSYAYMYPYLNNQMRTELNPGTTVSMANNPVDVIVRTTPMSEPRRVVPRTQKAGTTNARAATNTSNTARRVVQRPAANQSAITSRAATRSGGRIDTGTAVRSNTTTNTTTTTTLEGVSTARCMADYANCMNMYCVRENTAYNRCYCSAKLSQIDAEYQPQIENMVTQILVLRGGGEWTDEEMNEYWMERIGNYVGENSWAKLDDALNINWPSPDERVRGNAAFTTGHEYCIQHLRACGYMAQNLRDAYRSQISRDCNAYENALIQIKNAAESIIQHYSE